ncbi:MAG: hypothetical protein GF418_17605 [Chitinivibrionales bacterium]|nr:hypothetical protein [Chitinivibrionales bacterium]MBD3397438.1 hypothetical protein [Chitinivibrionales bacterium]
MRMQIFSTPCMILLMAMLVSGSAASDTYEITRALCDAVFDYDSIAEVRNLYDKARSAARRGTEGQSERNLLLARIEYLRGRAAQNRREPKNAERFLVSALQCVDSSIAIAPSSHAYRLKAEIVGQLSEAYLRQGKLISVVRAYREVKRLARKALRLNPRSGKALIVLGWAELVRPAPQRRNIRAAMRLFEKALRMPDLERDNRYSIFLGMGVAHNKLKNSSAARSWFDKALEVYPDNKFAASKYAETRGVE